MKKSFFFIIFSILYLTVSAQETRIQGIILDSVSQEPLPYSTIIIKGASDTILFASIVMDSLGNFDFRKVPLENECRILVSHVGYYSKTVLVTSATRQNNINLGEIFLQPNYFELDEVKVSGERRFLSRPDKITYMVDSSLLAGTAVTADLLKNIPEVAVDEISRDPRIKGKQNTLVLVNGIRTGESANIRTVNPQDVEKIEIITTPSSGEDSEYDGVINIVLKNIPRKGLHGSTEFSIIPHRWRHVDGYVGLVYGTEKARISLTYFADHKAHSFDRTETRTNIVTGETYKTVGHASKPVDNNHNILLGFDFYPSVKDYINISTKTSFINAHKDTKMQPSMIQNFVETELTKYLLTHKSNYFVGNYTVFYKRTFREETNSLTANFNVNVQDSDESNSSIYENGVVFENKENADKWAVNGRLTYEHRIKDWFSLNVGTQLYKQHFDGDLGGMFDNRFNNLRYNAYTDLYFNYEGYQLRLGLKAERNETDFSDYDIKTTKQGLFPTIILSKQISSSNFIRANYQKLFYYPSAWTLAPYNIQIDSMSMIKGNPYLKPYTLDFVELTHSLYTSSVTLHSTLFYHDYKKLVSQYKTYDNNNYSTTTYDNLASLKRFGVMFTGSITILDFIELEPEIFVRHDKYNVNGVARNKWNFSSVGMLSLYLPHGFAMGAYGGYHTKRLTVQGEKGIRKNVDAIYLMKRFPKHNFNLFVGIWGLVPEKDVDYIYTDNTFSKMTFKQNMKGFMFRFSYNFSIGKTYNVGNQNTLHEMDKK